MSYVMLCDITCHVMLYNICYRTHVMSCYITFFMSYVMLCDITCHVMLYNICYRTHVMSCYLTYVMSCYVI